MKLDAAAAERGIAEQIGAPLGLSTIASAQAIVQIAVSKMSLAVREVSVVKGFDPRDFVLVASGGAGPLHALAIARDLHIPTVVVPLFPSHFSALGMLLADERHDFVRTHFADLGRVDLKAVAAIFDDMLIEARARLNAGRETSRQYQLDMRYVGQEFALSVPVTEEQLAAGDRATIRTTFDQLYEHRYAYHSPDEPVEMINLRLTVYGRQPKLEFPRLARSANAPPSARRDVYLGGTAAVSTPVYRRDALAAGAVVAGPAIVQELGTTTVLFEGDVGTVADSGELIVSVGAE
jgi:N-methylhydantoinase A